MRLKRLTTRHSTPEEGNNLSHCAKSEKILPTIEKIFFFLFLAAVISTFVFWWTGLSDTNSLDSDTERNFAEILNKNFKRGDIVFTENDWDLDFLKYLDNGILPIFLDLKNATEQSVARMKNGEERIFLLLKSEKSSEFYVKKLNLKVLDTVKAGKGEVVIADTLFKTLRKTLVFSRDIGKAKRVAFSKDVKIEECRQVSEKKWQCSDESWNYVGLTTASFNGESRQAVWAHPVAGKTLEVTFDLPENSRTLHFNSVFAESAYHSKNRAPVKVEILADGETILKYANPFTFRVIEKTAKLPETLKNLQ